MSEHLDDYKNSVTAASLAAAFDKAVPCSRPLRFMTPLLAHMRQRAGTKVCGLILSIALLYLFSFVCFVLLMKVMGVLKYTPSEVSGFLRHNEWVAIEPFLPGE